MADEVRYIMSLQDLVTPKIQSAESAAKGFEGQLGSLQETLTGFAEVAAAAFSIEKIYEFGKELLNLTAEFQGFDNVIKYSSIDAKDAQANLDYIQDAVKRLHLPLEEATKSFSEMQAGFYGTAIEGQKLRDVFEAVSEASSVLHLSADKFSNVTFALKEIGELGTVQARQMRMLAFALPGAMNIAAQSMHMSTQQFHEAMRKGQIDSATFLINFSKQLKEHFEGGLSNAGHSLQALMNDAKNSLTEFELDMGKTLIPVFTNILKGVKWVFDGIRGLWDDLTKDINFDAIMESLKVGLKEVINYLRPIFAAIRPIFVAIYNGYIQITAAISEFMPELKDFLGILQQGVIEYLTFFAKGLATLYKVIATVIDVFHTLMVIMEKLPQVKALLKLLGWILELIVFIGDKIKWVWDNVISPILDKISNAYDKLKSFLGIKSTSDIVQNIKQTINAPKKIGDLTSNAFAGSGKGGFGGNEKLGNATSKITGQKTTTFNIKIDSLVKDFKVETLNMREGAEKVKDIITQTLLSAVNDAQIVAGY